MSIRVSDHAVLRYLERVYGVDTDAIRAEITARAARCVSAVASIGIQTEYRVVSAEMEIVMKARDVVTVIPHSRPPRRAVPRRAARLATEEA